MYSSVRLLKSGMVVMRGAREKFYSVLLSATVR